MKKPFIVVGEDILRRHFVVYAHDKFEAVDILRDMMDSGEVELDWDDFVERNVRNEPITSTEVEKIVSADVS